MNYDKIAGNSELTGRQRSLANLTPHQFQKGTSGNPSGRPRKGPATEIYEQLWDNQEFRERFRAATMERMLSKGVAGFLMSREVADRVEGPVKQEIDMQVTLGLAETLSKARQRIEE